MKRFTMKRLAALVAILIMVLMVSTASAYQGVFAHMQLMRFLSGVSGIGCVATMQNRLMLQ